MMLCSEVAMTDAEKESEARCTAMLSQLIAAVKKQTLEMEDLAVSMDELAVGLKAIVQPPGASAHALPPPVPASTATLVTAVDHAVAAAAPRAEAALAPKSPTKCSMSGPNTNASDLQVVAESDPEMGVAPALAEHSSAPSPKLFSTIKQDTVAPTGCSTAGRSCNIDVTITSPEPSDATILVRDGTRVLTSTPSGAAVHSIDLGDEHVPKLCCCQLGAMEFRQPWPPPSPVGVMGCGVELRPTSRLSIKGYRGRVKWMPPWSPPVPRRILIPGEGFWLAKNSTEQNSSSGGGPKENCSKAVASSPSRFTVCQVGERYPIQLFLEYNVNRHLAAVCGSYCYKLPRRHSAMLYKVVKHSEDYMLRKFEKPTLSHFVIGKEQNAHAEGGNLWSKEIICLPGHLHSYSSETSAAVDAPYSLGMLLQLAADKNRSAVLGVVGASYRDMLMSWGLPVFRDPLSPKNVSFDDCHFGTQCFQQVTKVKSRIVLEILRLGYNVLLSDVDVYWFDNPVQLLYSLRPATFAAQSDEYNETGPINLPRRLNSGFYFARSDEATITAMEMIVKHATNSGLSEQPSFYDVLCGKEGANRSGDDKCLEPNTNLTVVFLNRDLFPNGAYRGLWEKHGVHSACRELGCFIIHNNWVNGRRKKLQRQMSSGLWDYDPSSRLCLQNWSDTSSFRMMGQFHMFDDTNS